MEALSSVVRSWLLGAGLTAAATARRAGVSSSTLHRVLSGQVDPSVGTLREIALACGLDMELATRPMSDPLAAAAARVMLESAYRPPAEPDVELWQHRLLRMAGTENPVELVKVAGVAAAPTRRLGAMLLSGTVTLARLASAGDASQGQWAISGAAGLCLPPSSEVPPAVTILWCEDVRMIMQLLGDTGLRQVSRPDRAVVAVIAAEPELFAGSFSQGIIRYAAPIQIILDCIGQGGAVAAKAIKEAMSW